MNLILPKDIAKLKNLVRNIVEEHIFTLEADYFKFEGSNNVANLLPKTIGELKNLSINSGIYKSHLPKVFGGADMGALGATVIDEEISKSIIRLPVCHVPNILIENSTDLQVEKYITPYLNGQINACFAQTEPSAGSDMANMMSTRAIKDGDYWILDGTKAYISGAGTADFMMLQAVTDPEKMSNGGITMFLVDRDQPGVSTAPLQTWITPNGKNYFVYLENVRIHSNQILGQLGNGYFLGQRWLDFHDRLLKCSTIIGILSRSLEIAISSVQENNIHREIRDNQEIESSLSDVYMTIMVLRRLMYEVALSYDQSENIEISASMLKLCAAEWGWECIDKIMQLLGDKAERWDSPIPHWYHLLRHARIGGGTSEIMRIKIAQFLLDSESADNN